MEKSTPYRQTFLDVTRNHDAGEASLDGSAVKFGEKNLWSVCRYKLKGGLQENVDVVEIHNGRMHFVDGGTTPFNPHEDFCKKEITLVGSWAYNSWEYPNAYHFIDRAEKIGLPITSLITHRFPLERIQDAFDIAFAQEGIKVVVKP